MYFHNTPHHTTPHHATPRHTAIPKFASILTYSLLMWCISRENKISHHLGRRRKSEEFTSFRRLHSFSSFHHKNFIYYIHIKNLFILFLPYPIRCFSVFRFRSLFGSSFFLLSFLSSVHVCRVPCTVYCESNTRHIVQRPMSRFFRSPNFLPISHLIKRKFYCPLKWLFFFSKKPNEKKISPISSYPFYSKNKPNDDYSFSVQQFMRLRKKKKQKFCFCYDSFW